MIGNFMMFKGGELHHQALQLGSWRKLTVGDLRDIRKLTPTQYHQGVKYRKGIILEHAGYYYESLENCNCATPGDFLSTIIYVSNF